MESVAIKVEAEFEGDEPAPAVGVVFRSDISQDTLVVDVSLDEVRWNTASYIGLLQPGLFQNVIGDPDEVLPPYSEAEISAEPVPIDCPGFPISTVPVDILPIANFQLWVEEISFDSDYDLCKDGTASIPVIEEPIIDPVWIRNTKNEPVAYRRESTLLMNVQVVCNRTPYHDFEYSIMATGGENQGNYITAVREGHFYYTNISTVTDIAPRDGTFPDYVGTIDPLVYHWWGKKIPWPNPYDFRFMNSSSHKIFLTYDTPLLEDINVLALEKICDYAQGENQPAAIAELGVGRVYGEGWTYDPDKSPIFIDPLDVIRKRIGQCADYANLLTYLYMSIGIQANSVTIYNGTNYLGAAYHLSWIYTSRNVWTCVLSNLLTSCDNETQYWPFRYHATSFAAGMLCDASLGIIDTKANYAEWWRYYLQPAEVPPPPPDPPPDYHHTEPPTFEPTYYDWPDYVPFDRYLPSDMRFVRIRFYHP